LVVEEEVAVLVRVVERSPNIDLVPLGDLASLGRLGRLEGDLLTLIGALIEPRRDFRATTGLLTRNRLSVDPFHADDRRSYALGVPDITPDPRGRLTGPEHDQSDQGGDHERSDRDQQGTPYLRGGPVLPFTAVRMTV